MNLKLIDAAIASYSGSIGKGDASRLALFRSIWEEQNRIASATSPWKAPDTARVAELAQQEIPLFQDTPVALDEAPFAKAAALIARMLDDAGIFANQTEHRMRDINWVCVAAEASLETAGSKPPHFLEKVCTLLEKDAFGSESARLGALAASLALRPFLQNAAEHGSKALRDAAPSAHPLLCPMCGTAPSLACVAGTVSKGRMRTLWCSQCGAQWSFERVRCARCGTHNQRYLHFHHIQGDESHRIASCDKCGGYIRTIYVEEDHLLAPFSFEVEDVLTARLDAIAADPSFAARRAEELAGE